MAGSEQTGVPGEVAANREIVRQELQVSFGIARDLETCQVRLWRNNHQNAEGEWNK